MAEQLKIQITADVTDLQRGSNDAVKATTQLAQSANKSAKVLNGDFVKATNQASGTVLNFGRIVQDVPYAFNNFGSIANNIDPLFDSFRRLKVETGSTSAAFGALGKSLLGGAGIGLGISVVTSLITSFSIGLFNSKKETEGLSKAIESLAANSAKDLVKLTSLVGVASNLNASMEDRRNAIAALNEQYKEYLPYLEQESFTLDNISQSYKRVAEAILQQAVLKGIQEEISLAVEGTAKKIIELEKAEAQRAKRQQQTTDLQTKSVALTEEQVKTLEKLKNTNPNLTDDQIGLLIRGTKQQQQYNQALNDGFGAAVKQQTVTQGQIKAFGSYEDSIKRVKDELFRLLDPLLQLTAKFSDLGISVPDVKIPKIKEAKVDVEKGIFRFNKAEYAFPEPKKEDLKPLAKGLEGRVKINPVDLDTKKFAKDVQGLANIINQTLRPAFESAFSALLEGEEPLKAFFESLISSVKRLIAQLASAAIIAGILSALGGGSFFSLFGKIAGIGGGTGLAEGGIVPPGFPNDTFPARLTSNEAVIPLNRLDSMVGGGGNIVVSGRLRGQDLLLQNRRTQRSQRRTVGRAA